MHLNKLSIIHCMYKVRARLIKVSAIHVIREFILFAIFLTEKSHFTSAIGASLQTVAFPLSARTRGFSVPAIFI